MTSIDGTTSPIYIKTRAVCLITYSPVRRVL